MSRKLCRAYLGSVTLEIEKYEDADGFHYCMKHDSNWGRRGGITPFLKYKKLLTEIRHELKVGFDKIGEVSKKKTRIVRFPTSYGFVSWKEPAKKVTSHARTKKRK